MPVSGIPLAHSSHIHRIQFPIDKGIGSYDARSPAMGILQLQHVKPTAKVRSPWLPKRVIGNKFGLFFAGGFRRMAVAVIPVFRGELILFHLAAQRVAVNA